MNRETEYSSLQAGVEEESQQYQWLPANPVNYYYINYQTLRALFSVFVIVFASAAAIIGFFMAVVFIRIQEVQAYHLEVAQKLGITPSNPPIIMSIMPAGLMLGVAVASTLLMLLRGRYTGLGARTTAKAISGNVKIRRYNYSRTGNHWDEQITGTGTIAIIDVSNTGKHRCRVVYVENGEEKETIMAPKGEYWKIPCPVCKIVKMMEEKIEK